MNVDPPGQQLQQELRTAVKTGPIEISDDDEPPAKRPSVDPANKLTAIKMEPIEIDDDERPAKKAKVEPGKKSTTIKRGPVEDDELERMREKERKLVKEIEEAERLAEMKRERDALRARIEAAEARKAAR
jgi:hypothetical protein